MNNDTLIDAPLVDFYKEIQDMPRTQRQSLELDLQAIIDSLAVRINELNEEGQRGADIVDELSRALRKHRILLHKLSLTQEPHGLLERVVNLFKRLMR